MTNELLDKQLYVSLYYWMYIISTLLSFQYNYNHNPILFVLIPMVPAQSYKLAATHDCKQAL